MNTRKYVATFTEGLLATKPNDDEVHETYVASKREKGVAKDEIDAVARANAEVERLEKGKTVFARDKDGNPVLFDYMVRGFLKDAIKALRRDPETACSKVKAFKSVIDGSVFVKPRMIRLQLPEGTTLGTCERPLRAETPMGERVALASSEEAPAGTRMEFEVITLAPGLNKVLDECFEYAKFRFMGAWRNSGKGTADVVEIKEEEAKA